MSTAPTSIPRPTGEPRVSVVVRSFRRIRYLIELVGVLTTQAHDAFEVVVVEQTPERTDAETAALAELARDPRVRILDFPPLGGPRARNEGVRAARGALVVFVDDDDLPLGDTWLAEIEAHFADPHVVGVSCRQVRTTGERPPYVSRALARRFVMRYSPLMTPYTFARFDEDVAPVGWLHGTNSAVRREVALAAGLWDEDVRNQDEHSFAFKLARWLAAEGRTGDHLAFRKTPVVMRRMDAPGGMDKRKASLAREIENHAAFQHRVIGRYHPTLYRRLRPIYVAQAFARVLTWVWNGARDVPIGRRFADTVDLARRFHREDGRHRI